MAGLKSEKRTAVIERRTFSRLHTMLHAHFFVDPAMGWQDCFIFNISAKGMAIKFRSNETINTGSTIYLEVYNSECSEVINFIGSLRWIDKTENNSFGGIELTTKLEEEQLTKLR